MFTRDLSWLYSSASPFASAVTFTHGVTVATIYVVFRRAGAVVQVGEMEVQTAAPTARCKTSDVASAVRGDTMVISAVTYYVSRVEPINNEESLVHLSKDQ